MKKRLFSLLLCTALTLALLPATALAEEDLIVPGTGSTAEEDAPYITKDISRMVIAYEGCTHSSSTVLSEATCHAFPVDGYASHGDWNPRSGPGWSYDPNTCTLSLNKFRGSGIYILGPLVYNTEHKTPTVTVSLTGDSVITGGGETSGGAFTAEYTNLVIQGPGSLTLGGKQFGMIASDNNGDYKDGSLDGGSVTMKQGATLTAQSDNPVGSAFTCRELVLESGCLLTVTSTQSGTAGYAENLVVRGSIIAKSNPALTFALSFGSSMYCTVGPNVTIQGGMDAATMEPLKTKNPQTSPLYGEVTTLERDYTKKYPYIEFREGGAVLPETPTTPSAPTAFARTQTITLNGKPVELQAYALKDGNGNETNYVKLRDVAFAMMDGGVQFNVGWDGAVNILPGETYKPNGSEMTTPFTGDRAYTVAAAPTKFGGVDMNLEAVILTDDNGAGYTYYKLRDLGKALGFKVDWSASEGISVNTAGG